MAQAFDDEGVALGPEIIKDTPQEAFESILKEHVGAAEYRVRKLRESVPDEQKLDMILDRLTKIEEAVAVLTRPGTSDADN